MIDGIITFLLRLWDRIRGVKEDTYSYVARAPEEVSKDPEIQQFLKDHRLRVPIEERQCLCGCGQTMRVPLGTTQYCLREHRKAFRDRARERDLLKFRFSHHRPKADSVSLS